jgi:hypothetical protein
LKECRKTISTNPMSNSRESVEMVQECNAGILPRQTSIFTKQTKMIIRIRSSLGMTRLEVEPGTRLIALKAQVGLWRAASEAITATC